MSTSAELMECAKRGDVAKARGLLDKGACVDARDEDGRTPLLWAAQEGHLECARLLIDHGADVNAQERGGFTPLNTAVGAGHQELVGYLVASGANVNVRCSSDGDSTALHTACAYDRIEIADILIANGAEVEARNSDGRSPIYWAVLYGYANLVSFMTSRGARADSKDNEGVTLLDLAESSLVRFLVSNGARVDSDYKGVSMELRNRDGNVVTEFAASRKYEDIVELLRNAGALS